MRNTYKRRESSWKQNKLTKSLRDLRDSTVWQSSNSTCASEKEDPFGGCFFCLFACFDFFFLNRIIETFNEIEPGAYQVDECLEAAFTIKRELSD